jgi:hypothetical protein
MQKSGDRAFLTLLIEPRRFTELFTSQQLIEMLRSQHQEWLDKVLQAPELWTAVGALLAALEESKVLVPWPAMLAGWDDTRPIVVALFDSPSLDLGELAVNFLDPKRLAPGLRSVHHRVLVPARNSATLARALGDALRAAGLRSDTPGAFSGRRLRLWVSAERDHVRIEAIWAAPDLAPDQERALFTELQAPPGVSAHLLPTPALRFAVGASDALRAYVRPGRLRDFSLAHSAPVVLSALSSVDPDMKPLIALKGWSEIAGGELLFNAGTEEIVDAAFALTGQQGGVRGTVVQSLSESGQALYELGVQKAHRFQTTGEAAALGHLSLAFNLAALAERADKSWVPPASSDGHSGSSPLRDLANRAHECGFPCVLYLALCHPLGVARLVAEQDSRVLSHLPHGVDLTLLDVQDRKPRGALAVTLPSSFALKAALFALKMRMDLTSMWGDSLLDGTQLLRLGLGVDPATIYGEDVRDVGGPAAAAGGGAETFLDFDVNLAEVRPLLEDLGSFSRWLVPALRLHTRARLLPAAAAIVVQSIGSPVGGNPGPAFDLGSSEELWKGDRTWQRAPSGTGQAVKSPGTPCLSAIVEEMARAFAAVSGVDKSMRRTVLRAAESDLAQQQACAARDPRTRASAEHLRAALAAASASFN